MPTFAQGRVCEIFCHTTKPTADLATSPIELSGQGCQREPDLGHSLPLEIGCLSVPPPAVLLGNGIDAG